MDEIEIRFTLSNEDYKEFIEMLESIKGFDPWYIDYHDLCCKILFLLGDKDIEKFMKSSLEFWKQHPDAYKSDIETWEALLKKGED